MEDIKFTSIGIDIGKKSDPSAIVVAQGVYRGKLRVGSIREFNKDVHYLIPFLERLPLGTKYPEQIKRFLKVIEETAKRCQWECPPPEVFVDVTGVGEGIADTLEPVVQKLGLLRINRCRFTHGDRVTRDAYQFSIGKEWMANRLQILSEAQRIHLDRNSTEARALSEELLNFDIEVNENGGAKYGAMRPGTHDDLVVALALATLRENIDGVRISL